MRLYRLKLFVVSSFWVIPGLFVFGALALWFLMPRVYEQIDVTWGVNWSIESVRSSLFALAEVVPGVAQIRLEAAAGHVAGALNRAADGAADVLGRLGAGVDRGVDARLGALVGGGGCRVVVPAAGGDQADCAATATARCLRVVLASGSPALGGSSSLEC